MSSVLVRKSAGRDVGQIFDEEVVRNKQELWSAASQLFPWGNSRHGGVGECQPDDLREAMASLQIDPYTNKSVRRYKKKIDRKLFLRNIPVFLATRGELSVASLALVVSSVSMCAALIACMLGTWIVALWAAITFSGGIVLCSAVIGILVLLDKKFNAQEWTLKSAEWYPKEIYEGSLLYVPLFALQTAVDLKKACPGALIEMDECYINSELADPFLRAIDCEGNIYYLEVWDEPNFRK